LHEEEVLEPVVDLGAELLELEPELVLPSGGALVDWRGAAAASSACVCLCLGVFFVILLLQKKIRGAPRGKCAEAASM
jgi:hypothetical protein